jgi:hypothetical protein
MKDLTLLTLIAVFEEIFGQALFWVMVAAAVLVTVAFLYVVARDRGIRAAYFLRAELLAPVGGLGAILFVQMMTSSGFRDIGGPLDLLMVGMIGIAGAGGLVLLAYTILALARGAEPRS